MIKQVNGGSVLSTIWKKLQAGESAPERDAVLRHLCVFSFQSDFPEPDSNDPLLAVLANILTRGLPTLPSLYVEEAISAACGFASRHESERTGEISFKVNEGAEATFELIHRSFAIVDSRIRPADILADGGEGISMTPPEREFLTSVLPLIVGDWICQFAQPQRLISSLLEPNEAGPDAGDLVERFKGQRVDFCIEFPRAGTRPRRLIIEIDDQTHHGDPRQKMLDDTRDRFCERYCGAWTIRIPATEMAGGLAGQRALLMNFLEHPHAGVVERNYREPLFSDPAGMDALQLALAAFAITRIQLALLEALKSDVLRPDAPSWRIAVIERDIPCASIAVEDFKQLWQNLRILSGLRPDQLPPIGLDVYSTPEFAACRRRAGERVLLYTNGPDPEEVDLLLDVSVLQRTGFTEPSEGFRRKVAARHTAIIRSAYAPQATRRIESGAPIRYALPDGEPPPALVYFLQYLFRKSAFREGQVEILRRTLALQSVIALLPTGAGKSLTYQLSALLQPGIVLVVDPLKSLMRDQDQNLRDAGIDTTIFINSSVKSAAERKRRSERMTKGEFQFVFVSPERLQIAEFRDFLVQMDGVHFSYVVVDEAHCVSEWGHDFRTSYLRLGMNARKFCKPARGEVPLVGLTGTASFDVLADVQRELDINDDMSIVAPSKYEREELHFQVKEVPAPETQGNLNPWKIREAVGKAKQEAVLKSLAEIASQFEDEGNIVSFLTGPGYFPNSGLVFCPHVGWEFGVKAVLARVREAYPDLNVRSECFGAKLENDDDEHADLVEIQQRFKTNDLRLLVATKAFGMGIDKPNIRFTIHLNMPQSLESFYQEAGRAGRDRRDAYCHVLYSRALLTGEAQETTVDRHLMMAFHHNSFRGQDIEKRVLFELLDEVRFPLSRDYPAPRPGIERILGELDEGRSRQVVIGFTNDIAYRLAEELSTGGGRWSEQIVLKAREYCHDATDFIDRLRSAYRKETRTDPELSVPQQSSASRLFARIRTDQDTFKAIYRLSVVGAIDEYELDYRTKTITATVTRRSDDHYVESLHRYLSRYLSREDGLQHKEKVRTQMGKTALQKCLGVLIEFVYDNIAAKRKEAIEVMESAVRVGLDGGNFAEYVNTYFDSKYTPELRAHLREYDLSLVWDFMERTNGEPDAVNHLRGACDRLLVENPENAVLLMLRAFSRLLLPQYSRKRALDDLDRAWAVLRQKERWNREEELRTLTRFVENAVKYDDRLSGPLWSLLAHRHAEWLKQFNERFRKDALYA